MEQEVTTNTETTTTEKKQLTPKQKFIVRLVAYVLFGLLCPCAFLIYRFNLFQSTDKIAIGGWGIMVFIIVFLFAKSTIQWLYKGMKFSIWKQVISGFVKVILPLLAVLIVVFCIKNSLDLFLQALGCIIVCECIAIPINPLPQWYYEKKGEEIEGVIDAVVDKIFSRGSK